MNTEQMLEAKRLISKGGHPYIRRVKGKDYITVKIGRGERGFGRYNERDWMELQAHYDVVLAQERGEAKEATRKVVGSSKDQFIRVEEALVKSKHIQEIFEYLEAGYTPQQIIASTYFPWWEVEACARKHKELEELYGKPKPQKPPIPTPPTVKPLPPDDFEQANKELDRLQNYIERKLRRKITSTELRQYVQREKPLP